MLGNLDVVEIIKRILKYLIEGTAVALAAYYVPQGKQKLSVDSISMLSKRFLMVGKLSSIARMPLPSATIASAVCSSSFMLIFGLSIKSD